jgi:hypothetical protein
MCALLYLPLHKGLVGDRDDGETHAPRSPGLREEGHPNGGSVVAVSHGGSRGDSAMGTYGGIQDGLRSGSCLSCTFAGACVCGAQHTYDIDGKVREGQDLEALVRAQQGWR